MGRQISKFVCQKCGFESPKWAGQCGGCQEWNTLVETLVAKKKSGFGGGVREIRPVKLSEVKSRKVERDKTNIGELDRVLGGGLVPGSVVFLAGEPGIGKSTLLTQLALKISEGSVLSVLYVCGEESPEQIKLRIDRLSTSKVESKVEGDKLSFLAQVDVDVIIESVKSLAKSLQLVIVDSIQTMSTGDLTGMAGSVGQVRECSYRLLNMAKKLHIPVILVGHVTKEGAIAGPKVLEHLVDTVIYLEGDKKHQFRILRSYKNRFGSVDEVGVFMMTDKGLTEVKNPSDVFLEERQKNAAGSCVVATMEGTRPVLVEIQALVVSSQLAIPRRIGTGIDQKRLQLLTAVLTKKCRLSLGQMDVYVNVAGGLKLIEPAVDLGICMAIASSFKNKVLGQKTAVFGEVGLLGEVRRVGFIEKRVREAKKLGYSRVIGPEQVKTVLQAVKLLR